MMNSKKNKAFGKEACEMLSGEYRHSIDPKNRLFIPAKHREVLTREDTSFVVTAAMRDKCLRIFSISEWKEYAAGYEKFQGRERTKLLRKLYKDMLTPTPDSQGRIVLSPALLEYAGISKNTVIVGCGKYAEIWDEEAYDAMMAEDDSDLDSLIDMVGLY